MLLPHVNPRDSHSLFYLKHTGTQGIDFVKKRVSHLQFESSATNFALNMSSCLMNFSDFSLFTSLIQKRSRHKVTPLFRLWFERDTSFRVIYSSYFLASFRPSVPRDARERHCVIQIWKINFILFFSFFIFHRPMPVQSPIWKQIIDYECKVRFPLVALNFRLIWCANWL